MYSTNLIENERIHNHRKHTRESDSHLGAKAQLHSGCRRNKALGTLVKVQANEHGHVDDEHFRKLDRRLNILAKEGRHDDVLLDISEVRSVTSAFVKATEAFQQHLASQHRDVLVCDYKCTNYDVQRLQHIKSLVQSDYTAVG